MKGVFKKLYSGFLKPEEKTESKKCKAVVRTCHNCDYHFKKGEDVCPQCNEARPTCNNWALPGKDVCKIHGGHAGRPLTTGTYLSKGTFSKEEWEQIKIAVKEKERQHEFVYQVATAAFKKIIEKHDDPIVVLKAASEYFSKIAKHVEEIDKSYSDIPHVVTLDEISEKEIGRRIVSGGTRMVQNALLIIISILKRKIQDTTLYDAIYDEFPQQYKDLIVEKMNNLTQQENKS
jgi:hypothetical protein